METSVIVVGAGAAGLTAALRLRELGIDDVLVVERETHVGGRLATDRADGFLFDRGFQVLQTAYPAVRRWLDIDALRPRAFEPGAQVFLPAGVTAAVSDPLRRPTELVDTLTSPVGTLADKLRLARLVAYVRTTSAEQLFATSETSTEDYLRRYGFSDCIIERFFRPFYGGVYLERELATSSRMFLFTFKMFAEGDAVLPEGGIQAVAERLAAGLSSDRLLLGEAVEQIDGRSVRLAGGRTLRARRVIDTRPNAPSQGRAGTWYSTTVVYFTGDPGGLSARTLGLVPGGCPVGIFTDLSSVQPSYAPPGTNLLSVSLKAPHGRPLAYYVEEVRRSLTPWLGDVLPTWEPLRHYSVAEAVPAGTHVRWAAAPARDSDTGAWLAGDATLAPSLHHAMASGQQVAERVAVELAAGAS